MATVNNLLLARGAAKGLWVVCASGRSGKTHHLMHVLLDAVDVESLVAVTYTTRAASELRSRIRQEVLEGGRAFELRSLKYGF